MLKTYYRLLFEHITQALPDVRTVALYSGQYDRTEMEHPVVCPALYVEFERLDWINTGLRTREAQATIRLHLCLDYMLDVRTDAPDHLLLRYDEQVLEMVDKVELALQGWQAKDADGLIWSTELQSQGLETDTNPDGLQVWLLEFKCQMVDGKLSRDREQIAYVLPGVRVNK